MINATVSEVNAESLEKCTAITSEAAFLDKVRGSSQAVIASVYYRINWWHAGWKIGPKTMFLDSFNKPRKPPKV